MNIGNYELFTVETGYLSLDGGAMFGNVPKTLWSKTNPADEFNRIKLAMRLLVIKDGERTILVDVGAGNQMKAKQDKIYKLDSHQSGLGQDLLGQGVDPKEVTDVLLTHLHFDHAGGATRYQDGQLELTFPNAQYHLHSEQWEWANNPSERDRASYMVENFHPLLSSGKLRTFSGKNELLSGFELLTFYGHTPGMILPKISDSRATILYCADLIPTASHLPLPYIMGYDNNPLVTLEEKRKVLQQAVKEDWILVFTHDPYRKAGKVELTEKGFSLKEEITL
ncbi:MAG TPA: MBL fold metallo-hydrolase [bacterium]|nr:MBL fold metallo-hydrolase [bacterium]